MPVLERLLIGTQQRECVFRLPLSIMKANQRGWQRHVLQEDSQSTNSNELLLESKMRREKSNEQILEGNEGKKMEEKER